MKNNLLINMKGKINFSFAVILSLSLLFLIYLSLEVSAAGEEDSGGGGGGTTCNWGVIGTETYCELGYYSTLVQNADGTWGYEWDCFGWGERDVYGYIGPCEDEPTPPPEEEEEEEDDKWCCDSSTGGCYKCSKTGAWSTSSQCEACCPTGTYKHCRPPLTTWFGADPNKLYCKLATWCEENPGNECETDAGCNGGTPPPDEPPDEPPPDEPPDEPPVDPCDGVSCGSCQYCSGGNCYNYCSGTSSSCGCTSCVSCGSCRYCSGTTCRRYCSGSDTSCGCTSCTNCNAKDKCDGPYLDDYYCEGTSCDYTHELNTECAGLAADVLAVSNFYNKGVPVVMLNISDPFNLGSGNLVLSVLDEDGAPIGSCNQVISLIDTKLFYGTSVKNAHFYPWAESVLLTEEEIAECKEEGMSDTPTGMSIMSSSMENDYMSDNCDYYNCSQGTYPNYGEDNFYEKYPDLKILEETQNYLDSSDFIRREMPSCESLFSSLGVGFYDLKAKLEVVT